jgi:hypothetical protein
MISVRKERVMKNGAERRKRARWSGAFGVSIAIVLAVAAPASAASGWMRGGDMSVERSFFPAVLLENGKVLVASGSTAQLFDPSTANFNDAGTLTVDRGSGLTATRLLNGKVLIAGGQSGDSSQDSAELYDPLTGAFSPTGGMSDPRSYQTATLLADGRVLIAGGHRFNHPASAIATAELYDPATGAFTPTASMSVARQDHTATRLPDGRVLIAGGYDQSQIGLASAEIYDPSAGTFTPTGMMSSGRGNHTATLLGGGKVLIAGGHAGFPGGSLANAELFDPASGAFAPTGSMNEARGGQSATLLADGMVLIAGGFTAFPFLGSPLASAEIYDPGTGNFMLTSSMHTARGRHAATSLPNGDVLVAGGMGQCCGGGMVTSEVFSLNLVDTLPPTIVTPGDMTVVASSSSGAVVFYNVSVIDNIDDNPQLSCQPSSGSTYPLGATTVACTATDSAGNDAQATFTITVLPPLDIAVSLVAGSVVPKTGVASVQGSVRCNRSTHISVSGQLRQTVANRAVVDGFFFVDFDCSPQQSSWSATVTPTSSGRYIAGKADATASAFSCDQFSSCDFDQVTKAITLKGGK